MPRVERSCYVRTYHPFRANVPEVWGRPAACTSREWIEFETGDIKSLVSQKGMEGAEKHYCVWCRATTKQRALFWADICCECEPRTDALIDDDLKKFSTSEGGLWRAIWDLDDRATVGQQCDGSAAVVGTRRRPSAIRPLSLGALVYPASPELRSSLHDQSGTRHEHEPRVS